MSISSSLRKAAVLQEKIDALRSQMVALIAKAHAEIKASPDEEIPTVTGRSAGRAKAGAKRGGRKPAAASARKTAAPKSSFGQATRARRGSPLAGRKRASSPSGPLAPAVVRVLQGSRKPMNVRDILDGLKANGYTYSSPEPKKNLAARIYRLKGVKQVGAGLFAAE